MNKSGRPQENLSKTGNFQRLGMDMLNANKQKNNDGCLQSVNTLRNQTESPKREVLTQMEREMEVFSDPNQDLRCVLTPNIRKLEAARA